MTWTYVSIDEAHRIMGKHGPLPPSRFVGSDAWEDIKRLANNAIMCDYKHGEGNRTMNDVIERLWKELVYTHERVATGPISDRRTLAAYRNGLLTAYAIVTGESEETIRTDLVGTETFR